MINYARPKINFRTIVIAIIIASHWKWAVHWKTKTLAISKKIATDHCNQTLQYNRFLEKKKLKPNGCDKFQRPCNIINLQQHPHESNVQITIQPSNDKIKFNSNFKMEIPRCMTNRNFSNGNLQDSYFSKKNRKLNS